MSHPKVSLRITHSNEPKSDPSMEEIRARLRKALAGQSCRTIGLRTNTHPETVRRYLSIGHPSVEFLSGIARSYEISCDWLLLGIGPVKSRDAMENLVDTAPLSRLLRGVSEKLASAEAEAELAAQSDKPSLRMTETPARDFARNVRLVAGMLHNSTST